GSLHDSWGSHLHGRDHPAAPVRPRGTRAGDSPTLDLGPGVHHNPRRCHVGSANPQRSSAGRRGRSRITGTGLWAQLTSEASFMSAARWDSHPACAEGLARLDLVGYVFKKDSPSCGMERVRVHGGGGRPLRRGTGLFARALMTRLPLLPVEEEGHLRDAALCESFIEHVLAYARWKAALAIGMTRGRLLAFHTAHELLLRAHDPAACRRLGALVADARKRRLRSLVAE